MKTWHLDLVWTLGLLMGTALFLLTAKVYVGLAAGGVTATMAAALIKYELAGKKNPATPKKRSYRYSRG